MHHLGIKSTTWNHVSLSSLWISCLNGKTKGLKWHYPGKCTVQIEVLLLMYTLSMKSNVGMKLRPRLLKPIWFIGLEEK